MKRFKIEIIDNQIEKFKEISLFEFRNKHFFSKPLFHLEYSHIIGYNYKNIDKDIKEELSHMLEDNKGTFEIHEITIKNS